MQPDKTCKNLGPIWLVSGISRLNCVAFLYASFVSIAFISLINILQAYILTEHLAIPEAGQGTLTGDLALSQELIALLLVAPAGILSDRIGRRPVFVFGTLMLAVGFALYPMATSTFELTLYRCIYAVGTACVAGMIGTVIADYPQEVSRGKLIAASGVLNGLGLVVFAGISGRLPQIFRDGGATAIEAGQYTFWSIAVLCVVSAIIMQLGLKGGPAAQVEEREPIGHLVSAGFKQARNPRIALAYGSAFAARADLAVVGTFVTLWAVQAGKAAGLSTDEALAKGTLMFVIAQVAAVCWAPIMGLIIDRFNRVTAQAVAMALAGAGYLSMAFVSSPLDMSAIPAFALLGAGQLSALFSSQGLIGQEAPEKERGAVVGIFGFCGAIGIVFATGVGGRLFDAIAPSAPFVLMGVANIILLIWSIAVRIKAPGLMLRQAKPQVLATGKQD